MEVRDMQGHIYTITCKEHQRSIKGYMADISPVFYIILVIVIKEGWLLAMAEHNNIQRRSEIYRNNELISNFWRNAESVVLDKFAILTGRCDMACAECVP